MKDPIKPGPKQPHQWVPLFLAQLAVSPDLELACKMGYTTAAKVQRQRERSGYFDAAFRIIMREHRRRGNVTDPKANTSTPDLARETVSAADFVHFAGNNQARAAMFHADLGTLLQLCDKLAEAAGIEAIDGLPIYEWFNQQRRGQLERDVLAIGDRDPALAEHLQRHLPQTAFPNYDLPT